MKINPEDLEITADRPPKLGGQQVGMSPAGVWVKHKPTGMVAFCEWHRSQLKNKDAALSMIEWAIADL